MFGTVDTARDAVAGIRAGIDVLLDGELTLLPQQDLLDLLTDLETQTRRLAAVDHAVVAEIDQRGVAGELACANTATLVHDLLQVTPGEAKARVQAARDLTSRHSLTGEAVPPLFAATAAAERDGLISAGHVRVISKLMYELPADCDRAFGRDIERCLVQHAPGLDPVQLGKAGQRLLARLDPDGPEPKDEEQRRRRGFSLRKHADGGSTPTGYLTPQLTATLDALFDSLAAPVPAEDGTQDARSPAQRRHDALLDGCMRLIGSGTLPDCGGTPVTILARLDAEDLKTKTGYADTSHGDLISIQALLDLAAEAEIIPVVLNGSGAIMSYGRTRRVASPGQRRALAARDLGCSFPGCTRPPAWCQAHHIKAWVDGGFTDIDEMTLVCGYHHREFARRGWRCLMINGVPHWVPPEWLEPTQTPIRNTAHHVEITFDVDAARAGSTGTTS
ncbi:MAG: DUF222 domain-containing protein [Jatrophihabitantaceae bacterium]